jgi:hypothetical protein
MSSINFQRIATTIETDPQIVEAIHQLMIHERLTYEQARQKVKATQKEK